MSYKSEQYIHELDCYAFNILNNFSKFTDLQKAYLSNVDEKLQKINFLSSAIRLNENQIPEVYAQLPPVCEKLGIKVPELYLINSTEMNAATGGIENPYIFVTSELVNKCNIEQIQAVLAHECGHIACKHILYHSMAKNLIFNKSTSEIFNLPIIKKYLTTPIINALYFWDRCSELSADRAAVICCGSDKTIDMLLKVHGYDSNINREEFIKQAIDLKKFVESSLDNKAFEQLIVSNDSHPRLATRVYECYSWPKTEQYAAIINGTYQKEEISDSTELIKSEISIETESNELSQLDHELEIRLQDINKQLERYTNQAIKADYSLAIASGLLSGVIDSIFVGEVTVSKKDIGLSHKQVNNFIEQYAEFRGFGKDHLKDTIAELEKEFKVANDNIWKGKDIGVTPKNHHLADLAHHPTLLGLASAIIVKFLRIGTFVNRDGEWHFLFVDTNFDDIKKNLVAATISGMLNWIAYIIESKLEDDLDVTIPDGVKNLIHSLASLPMFIDITKCADNWFGHLVSDMGGSKNTAGQGMGIPGVFISLLYELASLPILKDSGLPNYINDLYQNKKLDLRHELTYVKQASKQLIPVAFNEVYVRLVYFLGNLAEQYSIYKDIKKLDWSRIIPFNNRTIDRMMMIASMTFTVADTADAAIRAAIESNGNWILFSSRFVTRFNYVGAGRAALAIVKEVSNESKETQLIHEKMLLMNAKTQVSLIKFQQYKKQLEETINTYLVEDIEDFLVGFDYMNAGIINNASNLIIKGNVIIQKRLEREVQFQNQEEFDDLMDSDIPLQL